MGTTIESDLEIKTAVRDILDTLESRIIRRIKYLPDAASPANLLKLEQELHLAIDRFNPTQQPNGPTKR